MRIERATPADEQPWLALAAEVEPLFGPLVADPHFQAALRNNIARGTAWCARADAAGPGALIGGMFWAPERCEIAWLAVAASRRRGGAGAALVRQAIALAKPPATLRVTTFGEDVREGLPARRLYERLGFVAGEMAGTGPEGGSRQVFALQIG